MTTTTDLGRAGYEDWIQAPAKNPMIRFFGGIGRFARRKPLGFACGLMVLFFMIIGDIVPETANKALSIVGLGEPVPYVADFLEEKLSFVYPYDQQNLRDRLQGSSSSYLLGTDSLGRDTFSRLIYGARVAIMVSFGAVIISELIATVIGISAGYYGGVVDKFAFRLVDVFQSLPGLVILITILGIFGSGLWPMIIVIGIVSGPPGSRVIRAQTLSVMANPFIEAARVVGATDARIMAKYILPNVFPLIILGSTLRLGAIVLIEASLSFLGFGIPAPFPSWGQMLSTDGRDYMRVQPMLAVWPGIAIGLLVFSFNLFGDALRDVLDPRLRGTR
jgi:peptide/nickel transport system permease protein